MAGRPPTDVFRPCLPLDPFAALDQGPWRPNIPPHAEPPSAVLVLGEPALSDLYPILFSPSLARSLIVLATHVPPYISQKPSSTIRILRLSSPFAQDSGALHLVSLLERADRVVRHFRTCDTERSRKLVQLAENTATGEFDVEEPYSLSSTPPPSPHGFPVQDDVIRRYPSPAPSAVSSLSSSSSTHSTSSSTFSITSSPTSTFLSRRRRAPQPRSSPPATDRAFDAIINFLPSNIPEKFLLKHTILVSTLTTSFFAAPPAPLTSTPPPTSYSLTPPKPNKRRLSIFSNRSSSHLHVCVDPAKENQQPRAGVTPAKKNPRRFSTILRRQTTTTNNNNELVHSAPCSRDSLPLSASNVKGKIRTHHQRHPSLLSHESERKAHLIHILPPHVYNNNSYPYPSPASVAVASNVGGASGSRKQHHPSHRHHRQNPTKPKPKLVQSVEQFLLAHGYPLQSMSAFSSSPTSPMTSPSSSASRRMSATSMMSAQMAAAFSGDTTTAAQEKAIPFLLPTGVFGSLASGGRLTIGEILLMGGLDGRGGDEVTEMGELGVGEGRVWISSADDVVWDDPPSPGISSNPVKRPYVDVPELQRLAPPSSFSYSPAPNVSRSAPSTISQLSASSSSSPIKPRTVPSKSYTSPPAPRHSTLGPNLTSTRTTPPSAPTLSAAIPLNPRRPINRSSSSPIDGTKAGVQGQQLQLQQIPTPPESSSSLEDEAAADVTPPYTAIRSVSNPQPPVVFASDVIHVKTPSYTKAKSDVGHYHNNNVSPAVSISAAVAATGAGLGRHPSSTKRAHYTTTSAAAAAAAKMELARGKPQQQQQPRQQPPVDEKAVKQKRRSSLGRVLMGIGKLVSGGGGGADKD